MPYVKSIYLQYTTRLRQNGFYSVLRKCESWNLHNNNGMEENGKGLLNGHEYVNLGLSVMWATCNIGADSPEEYGDYYVRGETKTKEEYTKENCETYNKNIGDIAGMDRDVAHVKWGLPWRMPTKAEFNELKHNCDWEWTRLNGVEGRKVTSRKNGNWIFLPATTGEHSGDDYFYAVHEIDDQGAYYLRIGGRNHGIHWDGCRRERYFRPVLEF